MPKVLILAGGRGTRLSSVTNGKPKALVDINGKTFLDLQLHWLENSGVKEVGILAGHGAEFIETFINSRKSKIVVTVIAEKHELGTGGAILNGASKYLRPDESFVVMNGDSLVDIDLHKFIFFAEQGMMCFQIGVCRVDNAIDYGLIEFDEGKKIIQFKEKSSEKKSGWVNAGIYYFPANFLGPLANCLTRQISLENDLIPQWLTEGRSISAYEIGGNFVDIGTPQRLTRFIEMRSINGVV